jgi:hypothetical protein
MGGSRCRSKDPRRQNVIQGIKAIFGFVTENKKEFQELRNLHKHIILSDCLGVPITWRGCTEHQKYTVPKGGEPQDLACPSLKSTIQGLAGPCRGHVDQNWASRWLLRELIKIILLDYYPYVLSVLQLLWLVVVLVQICHHDR